MCSQNMVQNKNCSSFAYASTFINRWKSCNFSITVTFWASRSKSINFHFLMNILAVCTQASESSENLSPLDEKLSPLPHPAENFPASFFLPCRWNYRVGRRRPSGSKKDGLIVIAGRETSPRVSRRRESFESAVSKREKKITRCIHWLCFFLWLLVCFCVLWDHRGGRLIWGLFTRFFLFAMGTRDTCLGEVC